MLKRCTSGWGRIVLHVILPAGLAILLFVGIIFGFMIPKIQEILLHEKRHLMKDLIGNVTNLLEHYHQRQLAGELTIEEAQQRVLERIRAMRYGAENKDYFWVHNLEPKMIMHPYRLDLEGQNIADLTDSQGKMFILDMNQIVENSPTHDGYVDYMWQWKDDPGTNVPKLSYVRLFEPWGWVVGTGIYLDDVHAELATVTRDFQRNLFLVFLIVAMFCSYLIIRGIRDEIQRQRSQQRLHESFERFKTVMDSLNAHVNVSDIATHEVLFLNESAKQASGDAVGHLCWQVLQHNQEGPCDFCPNTDLFDETGQPRGTYQWEFQDTVTKQWYECHDQIIRWVDGRWVRLEIATDITARKNADRERERLLKSLAIKNEELESIVYIASHDLRSPLINIQGFSGELELSYRRLSKMLEDSDLLAQQPQLRSLLTDDIPESLGFIKASTDKMQMLVSGLLQLSRLGIAKLDMQKLDMGALIRNVISACQYQINTLSAEIHHDGLPACRGDYKLVNQVFTNLIDNALKYAHPQRKARIEISGRILDDRVEYVVSDNGVGIESEHLTKIFDMFCRFNSNISFDGVGLGLTIVKRILDILEGQVRVESEFGKGSVFYITLPVAE